MRSVGWLIDNATEAIERENEKKLKNVLNKDFARKPIDSHKLADLVDHYTGLSWLAAQQDFGAKILADNLQALTVLEAERAVGIAENDKINRTYAFAHFKCCLPRWLLIALPTAWQLCTTLTELAMNLIRFKPGATKPRPKHHKPHRKHVFKSTC